MSVRFTIISARFSIANVKINIPEHTVHWVGDDGREWNEAEYRAVARFDSDQDSTARIASAGFAKRNEYGTPIDFEKQVPNAPESDGDHQRQ